MIFTLRLMNSTAFLGTSLSCCCFCCCRRRRHRFRHCRCRRRHHRRNTVCSSTWKMTFSCSFRWKLLVNNVGKKDVFVLVQIENKNKTDTRKKKNKKRTKVDSEKRTKEKQQMAQFSEWIDLKWMQFKKTINQFYARFIRHPYKDITAECIESNDKGSAHHRISEITYTANSTIWNKCAQVIRYVSLFMGNEPTHAQYECGCCPQ